MNLIKTRDGVYRQVAAYAATRLLCAANDNHEEPHCRQSYDVERALAEWRAGRVAA